MTKGRILRMTNHLTKTEFNTKSSESESPWKGFLKGTGLFCRSISLRGYDHEEIGHILNISETTSRTQYLRAKKRLLELMK